jgi:dolichyl-phosphate-mannose--protein O-mannosyl transferase
MPITWFIRRVLLDSILLPFFLSSVFFAIISKNLEQQNNRNIAVLISGIFLGLSIFIKISMVVMIPLVLYLVYYIHISKSKAWIRSGLISTLMIISANLSSSQFEAAVYAFNYALANTNGKNDATIISSPIYASMYTYVYHVPYAADYLSTKFYQILTKNIILISDPHYLHDIQTNMMPLDSNSGITNMSSRILKIFYGNVLRYDIYSYPYGSLIMKVA